MLQWFHPHRLAAAALTLLLAITGASASDLCPDEQTTQQLPPADPAFCAALDPVVRRPSALPLDQYEEKLNQFIGNYCHRRLGSGWKMDKTVRDAGPFFGTLDKGQWSGTEKATHMPVLIWYSPEMVTWLRRYRSGAHPVANPPSVPDGAMMIKEMYNSTPAAACRVPDLLKLKPVEQGAAIMIRDSRAAKDGWFWGFYGWPELKDGKTQPWTPDYPPAASNALPAMGFGQYCLNCHASARDNQTFASLDNIKDEPGTYLSFLTQDFYQTPSFGGPAPVKVPDAPVAAEPVALEPVAEEPVPDASVPDASVPDASVKVPEALKMPSQTYDNAWVSGHGPKQAHAFVTSDQCVGCHSAGGTGLQFEMTAPVPDPAVPDKAFLFNFSPYGTWRTSPMGLAGRDPIFFTQLASETQTFHPEAAAVVESTCLGCHGIDGQRQFLIDTAKYDETCPNFSRDMVDAIPFRGDDKQVALSHFGALARDGVSCVACHHMVLGKADTARFARLPQNRCIARRQDFLNPGTVGFARAFSGSFLVGSPDTVYGPFKDPRQVPMKHALGVVPEHSETIKSSEVCGTCHTVHLPVFSGSKVVAHSYEQTTYPEWAFSAYRTGATPDGPLPLGAGALAKSCQNCHMPSADAAGKPFTSKIAGIQEHSSFPQVENGLPGSAIDLPVRSGFAKHLLVGLNVFLIEMAKQFNSVLGIPATDPMLGKKGVPPLDLTEQTMLDQASHGTATIAVVGAGVDAKELRASVAVTNETGHKFPSGVGFRRAFVDFTVRDATGAVLWESGRTDALGVLIDQNNKPVAGEYWWKDDCSERIGGQAYQPHYQEIGRQDQVQIFQELVTAPAPGIPARCAPNAPASGELTTSFLSVCARLKDNRLLPKGFLPLAERVRISHALGAEDDMAEDTGAVGVDNDPAYADGGGDTFGYRIPLGDLAGMPATVSATLYYQAIPPFFLQDRFCTAKGIDADRLRFLTSQLKLDNTRAAQWKLNMVGTGPVAVARQ